MGPMSSVASSGDKEGQSRPGSRWFTQPFFLALLLAIATLAVYYPVHGHPFVNYDDSLYVTDNAQVQSGISWDTVTWAFSTFDVGTWLSLIHISEPTRLGMIS